MENPEWELQWSYSIISLHSTYNLCKYELFLKGQEVRKINRKRLGGTKKHNKVGKSDNDNKSNGGKY